MKNEYRMIAGYVLGGFLVIVLMPSAIYVSTIALEKVIQIEILPVSGLRIMLSILLLILGFSFGIWSIIIQNVVGKGGPLEIANIEISPKTKTLVVSGPYRLTRNPMLFGTFAMYLAFAVYLNSLAAVVIVCVFIAFMLSVVVRLEEKRLLKDFGKRYEKYRKITSMIIPWFPKSS